MVSQGVTETVNFWSGYRGKLLMTCALVCVVTLSGVFLYLEKRQERLYLESMHNQARALFQQVVFTRKWIAEHGGVFVEKLPWVSPNPYLKEKSVTAVTGKKYIKKNPAMVTRELSEYSREQGAYWFHITSLRPINPANAPNAFEQLALSQFEGQEAQEKWELYRINGDKFFRYIAPLYVEEACLECHGHQGYKVGDVRGGISVSIPMEAYYASLRKERVLMGGFVVLVALVLMTALYLALHRVLVYPIRQLRDFAVTWRERATTDAQEQSSTTACPENIGLSRGDELYDLYTVLCNLHTTVTSHQRDLQDKVSEATTELSKMNEQLLYARDRYRDSSMQKSQFIAGISHELRTPLTSIKGAVGFIEGKLQDPGLSASYKDELLPFLEIINRNINRFVSLVEDTLDLEKIEAGQLELHLSEVDMGAMIEEARQEFSPMASKNEVSISVSIEGHPVTEADPDRVFQVISNLVLNALRHSPRGGSLKLEASVTEDWVLVCVSDDGPGIPEGSLERVFELFQKGSKDGTGLGLTISKRIIESHGGRIWVEPGVAHGSMFCFTLPFSGKPAMVGEGWRA